MQSGSPLLRALLACLAMCYAVATSLAAVPHAFCADSVPEECASRCTHGDSAPSKPVDGGAPMQPEEHDHDHCGKCPCHSVLALACAPRMAVCPPTIESRSIAPPPGETALGAPPAIEQPPKLPV